MDFFVVPTVRFRLLYVWLAIDHGRRKILHFNVTANPCARWVIQQLRKTFPNGPTHRFMICDNDSIFSSAVTHAIESFGMDPKRTAFRSPWQNGTAERVVGSVRRDLRSMPGLSESRASAASTTVIVGATPPDRRACRR